MQVLKKKANPWTLAQREIIASIVNDALSIQLRGLDVVGVVTEGNNCTVVWKAESERFSFWFDLAWFRARVQFKKAEIELASECESRGLRLIPSFEVEEGWHIVKGRRYVGQAACSNGQWLVRASYGNWRNVGSASDAAMGLWMREFAKLGV